MVQIAKKLIPIFESVYIWEKSDRNSVFKPIRYFILKVMIQYRQGAFPKGPTDMNWGFKQKKEKKGSFLSQANCPYLRASD